MHADLTPDPDPDRLAWLAAEFERHRRHLRSVGYRMLGSMSEADDAIQETWIRLQRRDPGGTADLRGWLTVTTGRICLDSLRVRRSRRETSGGTWLPEPLVEWPVSGARGPVDPEHEAVQADAVGIALLVVLESLTPPERLAFVLHDVFGVPFEEIAGVVGRSPTATRQLASRARRRVRAEAPDPDADLAVRRGVVEAFLAAARIGDMEGLVAALDPQVVLRTDGPGALGRPPISGIDGVIRQAERFRGFLGPARPATVNGEPGMVIDRPGQPRLVASFTVRGGRIVSIDLQGDPAKTGH